MRALSGPRKIIPDWGPGHDFVPISRDMISYQSHPLWIPACAGMTIGGPNWEPWATDELTVHFVGRRGRSGPGTVSGTFSYQSPIPAGAGTPRYENRGTGWRVLSIRCLGTLVGCRPPGAGDKPPRYISHPHPLWIPACAGMTIGGPE